MALGGAQSRRFELAVGALFLAYVLVVLISRVMAP